LDFGPLLDFGMTDQTVKSTVYYDGSCSLCRAEIGYYGRQDVSGALCFVDVSLGTVPMPASLTQPDAMRRFHAVSGDGILVSGAAAFVEVWRQLPRWRWLAEVASWPGVLIALEHGYRTFLPVRPIISGLFRRVRWLRQRFNSDASL
jgi:predicted DCC family thiol-disulfide oxidoreductase YuxK